VTGDSTASGSLKRASPSRLFPLSFVSYSVAVTGWLGGRADEVYLLEVKRFPFL